MAILTFLPQDVPYLIARRVEVDTGVLDLSYPSCAAEMVVRMESASLRAGSLALKLPDLARVCIVDKKIINDVHLNLCN